MKTALHRRVEGSWNAEDPSKEIEKPQKKKEDKVNPLCCVMTKYVEAQTPAGTKRKREVTFENMENEMMNLQRKIQELPQEENASCSLLRSTLNQRLNRLLEQYLKRLENDENCILKMETDISSQDVF
jgi:hypothetical protein